MAEQTSSAAGSKPSAPQPRTNGGPPISPNHPDLTAFATKIYNAARTGDLPIFQQAIPAGLPANLTNEKGDTILMLACYHGHLEVARLLLENGADPNRVNDRGQSILAGAVFKKEEDIVRLLCEWGADPDLGDPSAQAAVGIFRMEGEWGEVLEEARRKLRGTREGGVSEGV